MRKIKSKKSVVIGMSGGIDSSVAAYLLQQQGYTVYGVSLSLFPNTPHQSNTHLHTTGTDTAIESAQCVCNYLNIPFEIIHCETAFNNTIIQYFLNEYEHARTPNPCVLCNHFIKMHFLIRYADNMGIDYIATGHYARKRWNRFHHCWELLRGNDDHKDQSYFLSRLTQTDLSRILFPNGIYTKNKLTTIARNISLPTYNRPESQEICFIPSNNYRNFILSHNTQHNKKGNFIDKNGSILGTHNGLSFYTIGQRRGIGLSLGYPVYVTKLDKKNNTITLGHEEEAKSISCSVNHFHLVSRISIPNIFYGLVKIRSQHIRTRAKITVIDTSHADILFKTKQLAVTPGQQLVIYKKNTVIASGVINSTK